MDHHSAITYYLTLLAGLSNRSPLAALLVISPVILGFNLLLILLSRLLKKLFARSQ